MVQASLQELGKEDRGRWGRLLHEVVCEGKTEESGAGYTPLLELGREQSQRDGKADL